MSVMVLAGFRPTNDLVFLDWMERLWGNALGQLERNPLLHFTRRGIFARGGCAPGFHLSRV